MAGTQKPLGLASLKRLRRYEYWEGPQQPEQCPIFPITGWRLRPCSSGDVLKLDTAKRKMISKPHMALGNRPGQPTPPCFLSTKRPHALTPTHQPVDRSFHSPLITVKETKLRMPKRQVLGFKSQLCHFPAVQPEASVITCLRRHFLRETALPW